LAVLVGFTVIKFHMPAKTVHAHAILLKPQHF
jgi:hypothetical protein